MVRTWVLSFASMVVMLGIVGIAQAQIPPPSPGQAALDAAARKQQYLFVLVHKQDDVPTQAMKTSLDRALVKHLGRASSVVIRVDDPAEKLLIDRWGLSRTAMPIVLAVAPNGAVTGGFPLKLSEADVSGAFVTPVCAACLKARQDGKNVLLVIRPAGGSDDIPVGVRAFQTDPQNAPNAKIIALRSDDPAEAKFLAALKIQSVATPVTILISSTGFMLATFDDKVTKEQIATKLKASQQNCCPGGNCGPNGCCPDGKCQPKP